MLLGVAMTTLSAPSSILTFTLSRGFSIPTSAISETAWFLSQCARHLPSEYLSPAWPAMWFFSEASAFWLLRLPYRWPSSFLDSSAKNFLGIRQSGLMCFVLGASPRKVRLNESLLKLEESAVSTVSSQLSELSESPRWCLIAQFSFVWSSRWKITSRSISGADCYFPKRAVSIFAAYLIFLRALNLWARSGSLSSSSSKKLSSWTGT